MGKDLSLKCILYMETDNGAQSCQYTKNHLTVHTKWMNLQYVNYTSTKLFQLN